MKKSTKIKLIVTGVFVALIAVALLQAETGFISKAIVDEKKEEYYDTYGLSEEDWELLNAEGITIEDAHAMEAQANRIGYVSELLDEVLAEIKNGTYESEEEEEEEIQPVPKELVLDNFSDLEGVWEGTDVHVFDTGKIEKIYTKVSINRDTDPLLFNIIIYDEQDEQKITELNVYPTDISDTYLGLATSIDSIYIDVTFVKDSNLLQIKLDSAYDLKRITEEEFNSATQI